MDVIVLSITPKNASFLFFVVCFSNLFFPNLLLNAAVLRWRHIGRDDVSSHQPHGYLLNRLFRRRSKKTSKLCVTDFCAGNSPITSEFPAQMASDAENISIRWRHHEFFLQAVSSLKPSDAFMPQWNIPTLLQKMACRLLGAKPLTEPKLPNSQ